MWMVILKVDVVIVIWGLIILLQLKIKIKAQWHNFPDHPAAISQPVIA